MRPGTHESAGDTFEVTPGAPPAPASAAGPAPGNGRAGVAPADDAAGLRPPAAAEPPRSGSRAVFVHLVIVVSAVLVLLMVSLMYFRWLTVVEPTAAIVVHGDPSHEGAAVLVTGNGTVVRAGLDADNKYVTPVLLVPGVYTVRVTLGERVVLERQFEVAVHRGVVFYLSEEAKRRAAAEPDPDAPAPPRPPRTPAEPGQRGTQPGRAAPGGTPPGRPTPAGGDARRPAAVPGHSGRAAATDEGPPAA